MKKLKGVALSVLGALLPLTGMSTKHHYPVYPAVAGNHKLLAVYRDNVHKDLFYVIPKSFKLRVNPDTNVPMLSHALFINKYDPMRSSTKYNLTLEADFDQELIQQVQAEMSTRVEDPRIVPLPITTMKFSVTQISNDGQTQFSLPFHVAMPNWTGDFHSLTQPFSMTVVGHIGYEPAISKFMMNKAGNAVIGTVHYGFKAVNLVIDGTAVVNIDKVVKITKERMSVDGFIASADIGKALNDAKNKGYVRIEATLGEEEEHAAWESVKASVIAQLFEPLPVPPSSGVEHPKRGIFKFSKAVEEARLKGELIVHLNEERVRDHSGDIDLTAGNVPISNFDPNLKYACDAWAKYSSVSDKCEDMCEPINERYDRKSGECVEMFGFGG